MFRNPNRIFNGRGSISEYFKLVVQRIESEIESTSENYILNVNQEHYTKYLVERYSVKLPEIHFHEVSADNYEKEISAEDFPHSFHVYSGEKYKRQVIQFFVPVSGNYDILKYYPGSNSITFGSVGNGICDFLVESGNLKLEVIDFYNDSVKVKQIYDENVTNSQRKYEQIISNINDFNNSLSSWIIGKVNERRNKFLKNSEFMSSLGIPLKKKRILLKLIQYQDQI